MGHEWLKYVTGILEAAGLVAGEEYPSGKQPGIQSPVAAVGLRELDCAGGTVCYGVQVLSPRTLGGWPCQSAAAQAATALSDAGFSVQTGVMAFHSGSDCFCIELTARRSVSKRKGAWVFWPRWEILCGGVLQEGVVSFRASRDQDRRIVGAFCQSEPVGISPGHGGWLLTLVQDLGQAEQEPEKTEEPFQLVAWQEGWASIYSGCCWNSEVWEHTASGLRLTRKGFAVSREVSVNG